MRQRVHHHFDVNSPSYLLVVNLSLSLSLVVQGFLCNSGSRMINVFKLGGVFGILLLHPLQLGMARVVQPRSSAGFQRTLLQCPTSSNARTRRGNSSWCVNVTHHHFGSELQAVHQSHLLVVNLSFHLVLPDFLCNGLFPFCQQRLDEDQRASTGRFPWRPLLLHPLQFQAALHVVLQPTPSCAGGWLFPSPTRACCLMRCGDSEQTPISARDDNSWAWSGARGLTAQFRYPAQDAVLRPCETHARTFIFRLRGRLRYTCINCVTTSGLHTKRIVHRTSVDARYILCSTRSLWDSTCECAIARVLFTSTTWSHTSRRDISANCLSLRLKTGSEDNEVSLSRLPVISSVVPWKILQLLPCHCHEDGALPYTARASRSLTPHCGTKSKPAPFHRVIHAPPGAVEDISGISLITQPPSLFVALSHACLKKGTRISATMRQTINTSSQIMSRVQRSGRLCKWGRGENCVPRADPLSRLQRIIAESHLLLRLRARQLAPKTTRLVNVRAAALKGTPSSYWTLFWGSDKAR